jgi:hypothetical protein
MEPHTKTGPEAEKMGRALRLRGIHQGFRSLPISNPFPDLRQLPLCLVRKVLQFPSSFIPIPAVVLVAFNLVQDGVNPASSRVLTLLHDFMGGIPFVSQGKVDGFEKFFVHFGRKLALGP